MKNEGIIALVITSIMELEEQENPVK